MTVIEQPPPAVPERLVEPLRIVAGRARLLDWFRALFQLAALCAAVWLVIVLLLGSRLRVPVWASIPLALAGWTIVIVGGFRIFRTLFRRRGDLASAAFLADAALPESQERISSAVELSQEQNAAFRGSPELLAVLTRQAEHHADTMDPGQVISGRQVMRWLSAAGLILLVWFILLAIFTPNMLLGMQRLFQPWNAAAALPQPILVVVPGDIVLAQGAKLDVTLEVKPPATLSLDNGNQAVASATLVQHFGGNSPDLSTAMEPTGRRTFRLSFPNVQQSFSYKIIADGGKDIGRGESPDYTVTVQSRPAVADVEVLYTFPKYTGLNPRTDHTRDGTIEALVGTKARVTIHATEPVKTAQLLIGDDGAAPAATLDLTPVAPAPGAEAAASKETLYAGEFTIDRSTQYHVRLVKDDGRDNPDAQSRTIRAKADTPPTIAITLPDPKAGPQNVRPDDSVPLKFIATDDYGISGVEALIQVDQRVAQIIPVPIPPGNARISGDWDLRLADILKIGTFPGASDPKQVTYQLRATDNRDPNPQTGLSAKQTLTLDKTATPLAQRLESQAAKDMASALTQAIAKLKSAQGRLEDIKKTDVNAALSDKDRQALADAQKDLIDAGQFLRQAADQADPSRLANLAPQLRDVADRPVKRAEEDVVKAALASDQALARHESQAGAARNIQEALDKLQQLSDALQITAKDQPLAQALERLAKEQQQLADALAKNPNDPKLLDQQKQLQAELDKLIKDNPQLQKPAANANQSRVEDLVRKIQQLQAAQQPINDQLNNVHNADTMADQAAALAREQTELNKQINQFSQQQANPLKLSSATAPDPAKLDPIVKELQDGKMAAANRDQKAAASTLEQDAAKLDAAQKKSDDAAGTRGSVLRQSTADAQTASGLQTQIQKLADDIKKAKADGLPTDRTSDPVNQQAAKLADQIKQASQQFSQHLPPNSPAATAAQNAGKQADLARAAASQGQADRAQQQLSQAADRLAQAAQLEQSALTNGTMPPPPADSAGKAATQARDLAAKQTALADQSAALAKSQEEALAAKANAAATADRQRELADRMDDATRDAQDLQQKTQGPAPDLSSKADKAAQALQQATEAQRQASQATRTLNSADAAAKQAQTADRLATAEEALTGQPRPGPANTPPTAQNPPATAPNNTAQNPPQNTAQNPAPNSANPGQSPNGTSPMPASPIGMGGQTASGAGSPSGSGSAAQSVQTARTSQSQALSGNAPAAQQAAQQLAQASQQLMNNPNSPNQSAGQSSPGQPGATPGPNGPPNGSAPGQAAQPGIAAQPGNGPSNGQTPIPGTPGAAAGAGGSTKITLNGREYLVPNEVQDVGMAPSDWVKLPPELQDQLLHAAQQPGPPEYRDMIKNYYSRIAHMQSQSSAPAAGGTP